MHLFFSVGEPSGDQHAAHLIEELRRRRSDLVVSGFGGPLMERAGLRCVYPLTDLAVMGFLRVLPLLWTFFRLVRLARRRLRETRPDAVILVDFPGFNWWIARQAKALGIPVFYYLPPQLWAWAPWRVERVRRFVDHVLCGLPFEPAWYAERGIAVEYVGHPFFDEIAEKPLDAAFLAAQRSRPGRIVAVLPGSRNQEVARNVPVMLEAMRRLHARHPDVRFLVACYQERHREACREHIARGGFGDLPIELCVGVTSEIAEACECCLLCSGSVSLELLARRKPTVVLYRGSWGTYVMGHLLIVCPYISLPNLIAGKLVMPEFPSAGNPERDIRGLVDHLHVWLSAPELRQAKIDELTHLCEQVLVTGATRRTADSILAKLAPPAAREIVRSREAA